MCFFDQAHYSLHAILAHNIRNRTLNKQDDPQAVVPAKAGIQTDIAFTATANVSLRLHGPDSRLRGNDNLLLLC